MRCRQTKLAYRVIACFRACACGRQSPSRLLFGLEPALPQVIIMVLLVMFAMPVFDVSGAQHLQVAEG